MTGIWLVSYFALWCLFLIVAVALLGVMRNLGGIYDSLVGQRGISPYPTKLSTGDVLPEVSLQTLTGEPVSLSEFRGIPTAFVIISPTCGPCHGLLERLAQDGAKNIDPLDPEVQRLVVLSIGNASRTSALINRLAFSHDTPILVDPNNTIGERWGTTTTPTRVIVDDQLRVVRQVYGAREGTAQPSKEGEINVAA